MATAVYVLCALTSAVCAVLLFRLFWRHRGRATRLPCGAACPSLVSPSAMPSCLPTS